ncbi:hypothetical protein WR25_02441 [Diploscapter pachys]|uniref:Receptor expression-enhancing protein n=1 Tax=Diploscapter pachys TaxID=2018661 RepID=A0A2A2KKD5_9BILA|nr:hypothetical protein WR25_02441 [Diploscapter pachys]
MLILVVSGPAEFFCNMIAFIYPAYASVVAIRSVDTSGDTHWLSYWTVFGVLSLMDSFLNSCPSTSCQGVLLDAFFLMSLSLPQTQGSKFIYYQCVDPPFGFINSALYRQKAA